MANEYGTVAELKAALGIGDVADDAALGVALEAASRMIDDHAGRFFYKVAGSVNANVPTKPATWNMIELPFDIATAEGLALTGSPDLVGKVLYLYNSEFGLTANLAYRELSTSNGVGPFVVGAAVGVTGPGRMIVTGWFGWPRVPAAVKQATLIQAARLFSRRHSPYGVAGSPEAGSEMRLLSRLDPDVEALLRPFRTLWSVV